MNDDIIIASVEKKLPQYGLSLRFSFPFMCVCVYMLPNIYNYWGEIVTSTILNDARLFQLWCTMIAMLV